MKKKNLSEVKKTFSNYKKNEEKKKKNHVIQNGAWASVFPKSSSSNSNI